MVIVTGYGEAIDKAIKESAAIFLQSFKSVQEQLNLLAKQLAPAIDDLLESMKKIIEEYKNNISNKDSKYFNCDRPIRTAKVLPHYNIRKHTHITIQRGGRLICL